MARSSLVIAVVAITVALLLAPVIAVAQSYPERQITIVVPAAPGGVTDLLGRALARHFAQAWGHEAIVENKPGANNQIAAEYVAKAAPDGYTLFIGPETTFVVNPFLYAKLPYDPIRSFTPISGLVSIHHALIVNPALPVNSVADLLALARRKPGTLNYGTFGVGSSGHLNMEALEARTGIRLVPVHYKGATPALTDVMAGHIQLMFISVGSAVPQARAGKVRMIAIGAPKRLSGLPEVPTVAESGVPGFEAVSWFALYGPANMPPAVVDKINGEVRKLFADAAFNKAFMAPQFFESLAGSPAELSVHLKSDSAKWEKLIHDAGIKLQ